MSERRLDNSPDAAAPLTTTDNAVAGIAYDPFALAAEERQRRLRRFNWLVIYLPLIAAVVLALGAWLVLAWVTLFIGAEKPIGQASGLADSYLILVCFLPLALIGAGVAGGGVYLLNRRRQSGSWLRVRTQDGLRYVDRLLARGETMAKRGEVEARLRVGGARSRFDSILDSIDRLTARVREFVARTLGN